jgi:hypothetical protein
LHKKIRIKMKKTECLDMKGHLTLELHDRQNRPVSRLATSNHIVLSGRDLVAKQFIGIEAGPISHIAVGTGATVVADADTALATELFRKAINPPDPAQHLTTTSDNRRKILVSAELDFAEGNGALTEAALFNAATGGVMYNRVVFPTVTKTSDFKLTLIWEIIF